MVTIKISDTAYQRLKKQRNNSGASMRFMIDLALDCWLGMEKKHGKKPTKR